VRENVKFCDKERIMAKGLYQTVEERLKVEGYSRRTIKAYLRELRKFVEYIRPRHPRDPSG